MFIYYGKRLRRQKLGFAADFCPVCRAVHPFRVTQLWNYPHLYLIPLGRGDRLHHEVTCTACDTVQARDTPPYSGYATTPPPDAFDLAELTHPHVTETWQEQLELERKLDAGALDPAGRAQLIAVPIAALEYMTCLRNQGNIRSSAGFCGLGAVILAVPTVLMWPDPRTPWAAKIGLAIVTVTLAALAVWLGATSKRWWARKYAHPRLAPALARLQPTTEELAAVCATLSAHGVLIGKMVNPAELHAYLAARAPR